MQVSRGPFSFYSSSQCTNDWHFLLRNQGVPMMQMQGYAGNICFHLVIWLNTWFGLI